MFDFSKFKQVKQLQYITLITDYIAIYCDILNCNPFIMIHIVS